MSDWLYPLSSKSDHWFEDEEGNRIWCEDDAGNRISDTGIECFKEMLRLGSTDVNWFLSTNYRNVRKGDRVWIYYGTADSDIGIVGLATIRDIDHDEDSGEHGIHLRWNRRATRRLIATPVPAKEVRKFIPWPAATVWWGPYRHLKLVDRLVKASGI